MFRDQTLLPAEAVRLAALGLLAEGPRRYGDLATEIRHLIALAVGPSLDLMGSSIELLRHEGLATREDDLLKLSAAGAASLKKLLKAPLRAPSNDASRLVLLLKLRFLRQLDAAEQTAQRHQIADSLSTELVRLEELRRLHAGAAPALGDWLDRDIRDLRDRIETFRGED
jgi:hypothetical protein